MSHSKKEDKVIKISQCPGAVPCPNNTHHPWGISQPIQTLMRQTVNSPNQYKGYGWGAHFEWHQSWYFMLIHLLTGEQMPFSLTTLLKSDLSTQAHFKPFWNISKPNALTFLAKTPRNSSSFSDFHKAHNPQELHPKHRCCHTYSEPGEHLNTGLQTPALVYTHKSLYQVNFIACKSCSQFYFRCVL